MAWKEEKQQTNTTEDSRTDKEMDRARTRGEKEERRDEGDANKASAKKGQQKKEEEKNKEEGSCI